MRQANIIAVACICTFCFTWPPVFGDSNTETKDVVDIMKLFKKHSSGVAILDTDNDGDLDCVTAVRTKYDDDGPTADYVWLLKGLNGHVKKNITYHFEKGDAPDKAFVTIDDDDGQMQEARALYDDYQTCAVLEFPYKRNPRCMLWTTDEVKDNVPSECTEQFRKKCAVEVVVYDKESCSQV
ncbi:uncharacterized protein [Dermacentor andersoni]|uniref:uncharacterized protein n=1 Tax=Dermacentor andersoni TaxID=34620 RepID=UPI002417E452|nr:uncharacterized protein LOC126540431 [Dermacentor andersoni]